MQKKHYIQFAEHIRETIKTAKDTGDVRFDIIAQHQFAMVASIAVKDNPRFDIESFRKACDL